MIICERCGTESPDGFRFCGNCGAELPGVAGSPHARKVVTALFCDAVGSTALGEELDPEALSGVLRRFFEEMTTTIRRHGGIVQKYAGDAVLAVFGVPRVHEDDALRAVRAAEEIGRRLPQVAEELGVPLRFRTGLNTGLVLTDVGKNLAIGDPVNVAARLEQAAQPGEILLGAETLRLVRDAVEVEALEPLALKGKSEPIEAFRLLRVDPVAPGVARRLDVSLVDRGIELQLLRTAWERAVSESACHLFTLLGTAGVGKSRLVEELLADLGERATVLRGRCLHYGEGITFWPLVEALTPLGGSAQPILERLSSGGAATPGELFWEVRRYVESLAMRRPVILEVDDLHWAEPMLLDLLDHIVELSHGAPILVLCAARPELLEERPGWTESRVNATSVWLEPLASADCEQLLQQLGDELSRQARTRVIRASEGNPLFIQEMAGLAREGGDVDIPPTIHAVLAERLERLSDEERELLEHGSVEGQVFHRSAVLALGISGSMTDLDAQLARLVRKDLIRPHASNLPGHEAFRFRHLLIRDAAYERMPLTTRAHLHQRYAHWLEDTAADFGELDEIAGWHLEQTVRQASELRRETDSALTRRAAQHLHAAGRRAADRHDVAAARNLFERALALAPEGDALSDQVRVALAERLIEAGDLGRADEILRVAERDHDEFGPAALCRLEWLVYSRPDEATEAIGSIFPRMLEALAPTGDHHRLARAHWLAFWVQWTASCARPAAEQVRLAAEHARKAGDIGMWSRALGWYVATLMYGPWSAAAIAGELDAIDREEPGPYLAACVALGRAEVERLEGRFDQADRLAREAHDRFQALGMRTMAATCEQSSAAIQLSRGNAAAAIDSLLRSDSMLADFGERAMRSTTQAMLAQAHQMLGAIDPARAALETAEELSAPGDLANFAITHDVRARLARAEGDLDAAERWARSAVDRALKTDFVGFQAEARLELARALSAGGRVTEAAAEARAALELFEAKGYQAGRDAAARLLAGLSAPKA